MRRIKQRWEGRGKGREGLRKPEVGKTSFPFCRRKLLPFNYQRRSSCQLRSPMSAQESMSSFINIVDSDQILIFVWFFVLLKGGIYISKQHLYQIESLQISTNQLAINCCLYLTMNSAKLLPLLANFAVTFNNMVSYTHFHSIRGHKLQTHA